MGTTAEKLSYLSETKNSILAFLSSKGIVSQDATFRQCVEGIKSLYEIVRMFTEQTKEALILPNGITSIADYAFYNSRFNRIEMPDTVTSIGQMAFNGSAYLENIRLSSNLESIAMYAFYSCGALKSIEIPDGVKSIGSSSFSGCMSLASVSLSSALEIIESSLFYNCHSLTRVKLPAAVKTVESQVFNNCTALTAVIIERSDDIVALENTNAFRNTPMITGKGYIYVPKDLLAQYQSAENWSAFSAQIRAIEDYPDISAD